MSVINPQSWRYCKFTNWSSTLVTAATLLPAVVAEDAALVALDAAAVAEFKAFSSEVSALFAEVSALLA